MFNENDINNIPTDQGTPQQAPTTQGPENTQGQIPPIYPSTPTPSTPPPSVPYGFSYDYSQKPPVKKSKSTGIIAVLAVIAGFSIIVALLCLVGGSLLSKLTPPSTESAPTQTTTTPSTQTTLIPETTVPDSTSVLIYGDDENWINNGTITSDDAYINATYKTIDSVVAITTETASYNSNYGNYVSTGAGSGVVFAEEKDSTGNRIGTYIITNNHVVSGATTIKVTLTNGDTHPATLVGTDSQTDIAVIKIAVVGLKIASLGDSSKLLLSQPVIAIGNPLGEFANSVTDGRISGLERSVTIDGVEMSLLQTNAAVNPGNSGGGLFDLNGDLVGIVNAKSSGSSIEGIGFAIPINTAKAIAEDIIAYGYVSGRPSIGVYGSLVTKDNYSYYKDSNIYNYIYRFYYANNNTILEGFYIENDNGVKYASDSGETFKEGDVVAEIAGTKVQYSADISSALNSHKVGETITVTVYRLVQTTGAFGREKTEIKSFDVVVILGEKTN
ncbi:MAG: trypsin-like peptidase domain-containing protein [Clostridia bacterium]|nr:trypsin-like peptidase domain-containing protein [Clostridia bacterium]